MFNNAHLIKEISNSIVEKCNPDKIILIDNQINKRQSNENDIEMLVVMDVPKEKFSGQRRALQLLFSGLAKANEIEIDFLVCNKELIEERLKMGDMFIKNIYHDENILYARPILTELTGDMQ